MKIPGIREGLTINFFVTFVLSVALIYALDARVRFILRGVALGESSFE